MTANFPNKQLNNHSSIADALNLLNYYDIVNLDSVQYKLMNIQQILKNHPYAVTEPKDPSGRWQTYYKSSDGKRKIIRAKNREELLKKLLDCYTGAETANKITLNLLFDEWIEYKKTITNSPNTIKRHIQHYNKYFASSPFFKKQVRLVDELSMEMFCNDTVKNFNLSRKEWGNIKTILNGMFLYARRKGYISTNPMEHISVNVKYRQVNKKSGKSQVFNTSELSDLFHYLDETYAETDDTALLAVKLNFFLGLRVGELVALEWSDIDFDSKQLHITREEVRNQVTNTYSIVNHTKTNTDRYIPIPDKAYNIFKALSDKKSDNNYIFVRDGKRLTSRQISYVLEKYARYAEVQMKSTHKVRKTYASTLYNNGVSADQIREMLGHSSLATTLSSYIYNTVSENETINNINKAFDNY